MLNTVGTVRLVGNAEKVSISNGRAILKFTGITTNYEKKEEKPVSMRFEHFIKEDSTINLTKGTLVEFAGVIHANNYEDKETKKTVYSYVVKLNSLNILSKPKEEATEKTTTVPATETTTETGKTSQIVDIDDEEIPF